MARSNNELITNSETRRKGRLNGKKDKDRKENDKT